MRRREKSGAVSVLAAGMAATLIASAAVAIDLGAVFLDTRRLQGAADLAAMAAAADIGNARARAEASVAASLPGQTVKIAAVTGAYTPSEAVAPAGRFTPNGPAANAVRVELEAPAPLFFAKIFTQDDTVKISRQATAATAQLASFQIGTRLLSVKDGAANAVLSALTGSKISLSLMDYNALVGAEVDLLSFAKALRAKANLQALTFDEMLATEIEPETALAAIAETLKAAEQSRAVDAIKTIAAGAAALTPVALKGALDLGPYGAQDEIAIAGARRISVNALDLSNAILEVANGERQVKLTLGVSAPGLTKLDAWLAIGERPNNSPWLTVTDSGDTIIRTAQMRLYIEAQLLGGGAGVSAVRVPIFIEAASGQAKLDTITCNGAAPSQVTLNVAPSIGKLAIADIDTAKLTDFKTALPIAPATFVNLLLIKVTGSAYADLGGYQWQKVSFSGADIAARTIKTVETDDLVQATVTGLLGDLQLTVSAFGFGVNPGAISAAVATPLAAAAPALDMLVNDLTDFLGVHLGEADLRVNGVRCRGAALVQ